MKYERSGDKPDHLKLVNNVPTNVKGLTWGSPKFIKLAKQGEREYEAQAERERDMADYYRRT
jgi:hypothetical protein